MKGSVVVTKDCIATTKDVVAMIKACIATTKVIVVLIKACVAVTKDVVAGIKDCVGGLISENDTTAEKYGRELTYFRISHLIRFHQVVHGLFGMPNTKHIWWMTFYRKLTAPP